MAGCGDDRKGAVRFPEMSVSGQAEVALMDDGVGCGFASIEDCSRRGWLPLWFGTSVDFLPESKSLSTLAGSGIGTVEEWEDEEALAQCNRTLQLRASVGFLRGGAPKKVAADRCARLGNVRSQKAALK